MKKAFRILIAFCFKQVVSWWPTKSLPKFGTVMVIAPHPDDEILGLGGIILQSIQKGSNIHIVYLSDGEGSATWPDKQEIKKQRILLTEKVCTKLGLKETDITRLHLLDGAVPHPDEPGFEKAVATIKQLIETLKPDAVFATHTRDYWPYDHVACAQLAKAAVQQSRYKTQLWFYWVWAWYNLKPWQIPFLNKKEIFKIDISDFLLKKEELINIYLNALTPEGKPWSGVLPNTLIKALKCKYEVVEKIDY